MMRLQKACIAVLCVLVFCGSAGAEFYQYRDESGKIVFTDDLSRLPEKERERVLRFQSMNAETVEGETPEEGEEAKTEPGVADQAMQLEAERKALGEELARLQALQAVLSERAASLLRSDVQAIEAHNQEVEAFDAAKKAYDQRRARYNTDVEAFNARILEKEREGQDGQGADQKESQP
ncbi:DUF4124 domain-containing protein [Desulfobotulus sp.]|uniref:DUF4124 domain-containing protein n=1 Tax=Desulfobotulus sp. TaxID=1940337 RepID=UPI002A35C71B|nr:DUF4124 domain-containing protein [Desulfobotulus sp.]MDY0164141.1 DUF4124 domain-containing protein [Desulfobotulus sp.]